MENHPCPRFTARQEAVSGISPTTCRKVFRIRVIKAFVREKAQRYHFLKRNENTMEKNLSIAKIQSIVIPILDVIIGLSLAAYAHLHGGYLALVRHHADALSLLTSILTCCLADVSLRFRQYVFAGSAHPEGSRRFSKNSLPLQTPTKTKRCGRH